MTYDPLITRSPHHQPWPDSYWASTVERPQVQPAVNGICQTDVAIVGGGFTGLLTAYYLASEFNVDCCVIEANQIGFGASGRNAGFVLKGSGRLGYQQMAKRWGLETTQGVYQEFSEAVQRVESLITTLNINCDTQAHGYIKVAHNQRAYEKLKSTAAFMQQHLGDSSEFLSKEDLQAQYMNNYQAYGALRLNDGFGVNPLKLVLGYKEAVIASGVSVYESSCVSHWLTEGGQHRLLTEHGEVRANKVITAGNAYTPKKFNGIIDKRFLPILSNIIVTAPLSERQLALSGLKTHQVTMDTRLLKYYYRLLPDNRLLFGGRGAITGKNAQDPIYQKRLLSALSDCFPALSDCPVTHNWTGWIAAALDDMPHVFSKNGVGYSLGYCGSGVAYSAQAAYRLAQSIVGETVPNLPLYQTPIPKFPYAGLRRLGQRGYYHYAWLKDRYF
ncbi:NAD(P)/FAD-dependent oxidoreductase [Shewanella colwelliana]|uniref:NAD(P)/FAD-dependent oxidoreductase n=1 Tax=Shewanella colwelliana TaxID=23 RepID=UPI003D0886C6